MSAFEEKAAIRREYMIKAEVEKKLAQLEIDQRVQQADPLLQERIQLWIKEEVGKAMKNMQLDMMSAVRNSVQLESQLYYARSVAALPIHRVRSPTPVNVDEQLPNLGSPPILRRQDGYMINCTDLLIEDEECKEDDNIEWDIPEM